MSSSQGPSKEPLQRRPPQQQQQQHLGSTKPSATSVQRPGCEKRRSLFLVLSVVLHLSCFSKHQRKPARSYVSFVTAARTVLSQATACLLRPRASRCPVRTANSTHRQYQQPAEATAAATAAAEAAAAAAVVQRRRQLWRRVRRRGRQQDEAGGQPLHAGAVAAQ
jgi:hypothetical protein